MASKLGNHNASWVEQALDWAQLIANGESWENICNAEDTANCYRLIVWKNGYACVVGGSVYNNNYLPASYVHHHCFYYMGNVLLKTVPLVVSYK